MKINAKTQWWISSILVSKLISVKGKSGSARGHSSNKDPGSMLVGSENMSLFYWILSLSLELIGLCPWALLLTAIKKEKVVLEIYDEKKKLI